MTILIFDENITGHHLEYLHHYYKGAMDRPNDNYIFCVDNAFLNVKDNYNWPPKDNIKIHILSSEETSCIRNSSGLHHVWRVAKILASKSKLYSADRVILTNFIFMVPYILLVMPKGIKVRGIIYRIYLYNRNKVSWLRYHIEDFCYRLMSWSSVMETIFILNDQHSADALNRRFNTQKFTFLPDPVPDVDLRQCRDLRSELNIPNGNRVFLHFGGLSQRKGTIDILNAINISCDESLNNMTFVFLGNVYNEIKDEFYFLLEKAKSKAQILVYDKFCDYDFLYNMCYTCDIILMPYHLTSCSSGVLGYSTVFGKPIIGPSDGLIGRLIDVYKMGLSIDINAKEIARAFSCKISCNSHRYVTDNSLNQFIDLIYL